MRHTARRRTGFTLVELMFAAAMLVVASLALFGGISFCSRQTHDVSQFLAADAYAFDVAWMRFNEDFENYTPCTFSENISSNAAPVLWNAEAPARCYTIITNAPDMAGFVISVSVSWGPPNHRRVLSNMPGIDADYTIERDFNHPVRVFRSQYSRRVP